MTQAAAGAILRSACGRCVLLSRIESYNLWESVGTPMPRTVCEVNWSRIPADRGGTAGSPEENRQYLSKSGLLGSTGALREPAGTLLFEDTIMVNQFQFVIVRCDDRLSSAELKNRLEAEPTWDSSIQMAIVKSTLDTRPADPTFLSVVAAGSAAIGALFAALGTVVQSLGKQKIVIRFPNGTEVEVEGKNAEEMVKRLIAQLELKPGSKMVISV